MDRATAHAHGVDHGDSAGGDIVAVAHAAGRLPGDVLTQLGAALSHKVEQALGFGIDRLGRAGDAAMYVHRDFVGRLHSAQQILESMLECLGSGHALWPDVEAQHGVVGNDIVRIAAFDLRRVHGQVRMAQALEPYGEVGRMSFGDMDISDDESTLWVVNLFDDTLYSIPVQTAAVVLADIDGFALPSPTCNGEIRPGALEVEDGLVYVGLVCNGPTIFDLRAYVYAFDPDTSGFTQVLNQALSYGRGDVVDSGGSNIPAEWQPWSDDFADVLGPVMMQVIEPC